LSTLTAVLTAGLILRLTRLVVADQISHRLRLRIALRLGVNHPITTLITCTWCMSVWIAAAVCTAAWWWADTRWWFLFALAATASLAAGWTSRWLDPAED
jgi:hypothetical protein